MRASLLRSHAELAPQTLQLNSLRPANDAFCELLRTRLKACLPLMKALKPFARTFFSEYLLSPEALEELNLYDRPEKPARKGSGFMPASRTDTKGKAKQPQVDMGPLIDFGDDKGAATQPAQHPLGPLVDVDDVKEPAPEPPKEYTTEGGIGKGYHAGLGMLFKYPGDPKKLRERSKMKLWKDYLLQHGRNLTLIRFPTFNRLVQVGLPNRLRGEMWELMCGSIFRRLDNPGVYHRILDEYAGRSSISTDDIEKDLHRR